MEKLIPIFRNYVIGAMGILFTLVGLCAGFLGWFIMLVSDKPGAFAHSMWSAGNALFLPGILVLAYWAFNAKAPEEAPKE